MNVLATLGSALVVAGALTAAPAWAARETIEDIVNRTWTSLPAYCHAKLRGTPAEHEKWTRTLGPGYGHIHHYCFGLAQAMAAQLSPDAKKRNEYLRNALIDYSYVISHSNPRELSIMSSVYMDRGKTYLALRDFEKAKADMSMASRLAQPGR